MLGPHTGLLDRAKVSAAAGADMRVGSHSPARRFPE